MVDQGLSLKICGLTDSDQACAIAAMGVQAIGVIGVAGTPRFVEAEQRRAIFQRLAVEHPSVQRVWVVADLSEEELGSSLSGEGQPSVIQLHGQESPHLCEQLRRRFPQIAWWKALRLRDAQDLSRLDTYTTCVDALLLDAWSPSQLGGTGHRLDPAWLTQVDERIHEATPWWLAGGVSAEWVPSLLKQVRPFGLDASSRLEDRPGVKNLDLVRELVTAVKAFQATSTNSVV